MDSYKTLQLFFLALLPTLSVGYEIKGIQIVQNPSYWDFKFLCPDDLLSCSFTYSSLPSSWSQGKNKVRIPIRQTKNGNAYNFDINLALEPGVELERNVEVFFQGGKADIKLSQKINKRNKNSLNSSFQPKNKEELSWLQSNGIMPYIPTIELLDEIILERDIVEVTKVVQYIISDDSDCAKKTIYLQQVIGRMNQHIQYNKKMLREEDFFVKKVQIELQALMTERSRIKEQLEHIQTQEYDGLVQEKQKFLGRKKSYQSKYPTSYQKKLDQHLGHSYSYEDISSLHQEIEDDQKQANELQKQIQQLLKKKTLLEEKIRQNQKKVRKISKNNNSKTLIKLQRNFKLYTDMATQYGNRIKKVSEDLEALEKKLLNDGKQKKIFEEKLKEIEEEIAKGKKVGRSDETSQIQRFIQNLQRNSPKIEESLNQCLEVQNSAKVITPTLIYVTTPLQKMDAFSNLDIPQPDEFRHLRPILQSISIFENRWILKYGVPRTSSFLCDFTKNVSSGYGVITGINRGLISVRDYRGALVGLQLSSCSEIRAISNRFLPKARDYIEWEGEAISDWIVNVYVADIFRR